MSNSHAPANKYTALISNTLIFGISTMGSKLIPFVLTRLYTEWFDTAEYGIYSLIVNTCNLILPVMYLCIAEAVIRFGMEKKGYRRSDVFSVGIITVLAGWGVLWCFYPLIGLYQDLAGYRWLMYLYCLTSALRTVITSYVRATGLVRFFAIDGIFTTITTVVLNLVFIISLDMGVTGFVLSIVCADGFSALALFLMLRLHKFLKLRGIEHHTIYDMLRYSLPLIPTAAAWWIISLSDTFFIKEMIDEASVGLYTANKLPTILTVVSAFFTRAWELSAFSEYKSKEGEKFFSNVFRSYYTFIFLGASGLILLVKPYAMIGVAGSYYESWRYGPLLILAVSCQCLVTFLGAIYNAERKNAMISITTFIGAALNIFLNWTLIPDYGPQGAAFATFISYLVVFLIRAVDTRRYIKIQMQPLRMAFSLALLLLQTWVALSEPPLWVLWECLLFLVLAVINAGYLIFLGRRVVTVLAARRRRA